MGFVCCLRADFINHRKVCVLLIILVQVSGCFGNCTLFQPQTATVKEKNLLNSLKPLYGLTFVTKDLVDPANYKYTISICGKIKNQSEGVGGLQQSQNVTHIIGRYNQVDVMGGSDWLILTYYGGDVYDQHCNKSNRLTKIMIICNPDVFTGKFEIIEERRVAEKDCFYLFELDSNVACSLLHHDKKPTKLSSGSVFCILFFTLTASYLMMGFLYKRFVIGAKGLEQIPNYSFWKDFGNLQADGCDYFCRCGSRQESHSYRGIDDHLKIEDERDDQLLNM